MSYNKEQILLKLAEVEQLIMKAECDGESLADLENWMDVGEAFNKLQDAVEYYID